MGNLIKKFSDNSVLEYDQGRFDKWCIYLTRPNIPKYAPQDYQYFRQLHFYGKKYGFVTLYKDYVEIYNLTSKTIAPTILNKITELSIKYGEDQIEIDIVFTILYAGMVAEENKTNTKLGKRVKRLGVYQVLIEGINEGIAANFSRGKKWTEIAEECRKRGF